MMFLITCRRRLFCLTQFIIVLCFITFSQNSMAGWLDSIFSYDSYDDCILGNIKGNETAAAAREIRKACRGKFPPKITLGETLPSPKYAGELSVIDSFWNYNPNLGITALNVSFKNTTTRVVKIVDIFGQSKSVSCKKGDAIFLGKTTLTMSRGGTGTATLYPEDKVRDKNLCIFVDGFYFE